MDAHKYCFCFLILILDTTGPVLRNNNVIGNIAGLVHADTIFHSDSKRLTLATISCIGRRYR
jgi:hypothetical protein